MAINKMTRNRIKNLAEEYRIQVLNKNGEAQNHLAAKSINIEHICKGGFRFLTDQKFELEDRVKVELRFPDEHTQEVLGRICYSDAIDDDRTAYGFSVLDGFYSLQAPQG
jgi:hypothetical protein